MRSAPATLLCHAAVSSCYSYKLESPLVICDQAIMPRASILPCSTLYGMILQLNGSLSQTGSPWPSRAPKLSGALLGSSIVRLCVRAFMHAQNTVPSLTDHWRHVVYACYQPRSFARDEDLRLKAQAWEEYRVTTHWPAKNVHLFPKSQPGKGMCTLSLLMAEDGTGSL